MEALKRLASHIFLLAESLILSPARFEYSPNRFFVAMPVSYIPLGQAMVCVWGGECVSVYVLGGVFMKYANSWKLKKHMVAVEGSASYINGCYFHTNGRYEENQIRRKVQVKLDAGRSMNDLKLSIKSLYRFLFPAQLLERKAASSIRLSKEFLHTLV